MTSNDIRAVVRSQPFRPFTLYMDDGSSWLIEHPDGIWLGNFVAIVSAPNKDDDYDNFMELSVRHVTRIERTGVGT